MDPHPLYTMMPIAPSDSRLGLLHGLPRLAGDPAGASGRQSSLRANNNSCWLQRGRSNCNRNLRGIIYLTAFCQEASRFCDRRRDGILTEARRQFSQSQPEKGSLSTQHEAVIDAVIGASTWWLRRRRVHSSAPSSACARPDRPSRFSRPPVRVLRCPEHVPSPSRTLPKHRISHGRCRFWPS